MSNDRAADIRDVLSSLRTRLRAQIEIGRGAESREVPVESSKATRGAALQEKLEAIRRAHRQVGLVNPRHPGAINSLIQLLKRFIRRILEWQIRPVVDFQASAIEFLNETADMLAREELRLAGLEKKMDLIAAELSALRHDLESTKGNTPSPAKG